MISIIVPIYNESANILSFLYSLLLLKQIVGNEDKDTIDFETEIILVDGGSSDTTIELVTQFLDSSPKIPTFLYKSEKGRGAQLCMGANKARGDILWFLHADSHVDVNSLQTIAQALKKTSKKPLETQVDGEHRISLTHKKTGDMHNAYTHYYGCFSLYFFDSSSILLKIIAWGSNIRAKYGYRIFGDQGLFVTKKYYDKCGGFSAMPLMEDIEFSKRLSKEEKPIVLNTRIGTSARKFLEEGILRTWIRMLCARSLYRLGFLHLSVVQYYKRTHTQKHKE